LLLSGIFDRPDVFCNCRDIEDAGRRNPANGFPERNLFAEERSEQRMKRKHKFQHAVVIGGSIAGILTARVLYEHGNYITILDRDALPASREARRGVPQGRNTHGLLASGLNVLEALFPRITEELIAAGAVTGDILGDCRWFMEGACHTRFVSGLEGVMSSRPFLETIVRERVRNLPNVSFRDNCAVSGLVVKKGRVIGVKTNEGELPADLVIDAAGRGTHTPQWLEAMGFPKPEEERVEIGLNYTTRRFRRKADDLDGDLAVIIPGTTTKNRGGVMLAQEGGLWSVSLNSRFSPGAPAELDGFIEFAKTLPAPYIHEVVRQAEPVGEASVTRFPASVRRRYEKLRSFPDGYLVIGDALSSFNPVYGQGMSAAALEAMELNSVLKKGTKDLARRFFQRAAKVVDIPWSLATGNDLRVPETVGRRTFVGKVMNAYVSRLHKAAHHDRAVALAFHKVGNLLAPPPSILAPQIALRVLWANLHPHSKQARSGQMLSTRAAG
jgi:2-polyprenyl-6-methoxyphenol hydroxylase-like FAD-dependent oxidoreductase